MIRYKHVTIGASAAGETTVDALSGLGEKKRKILQLWYVPAISETDTPALDGTNIRAYKGQEQVVDFRVDSFNLGVYSGIYLTQDVKPLDLDMDLDRGVGFSLGLHNASETPVGSLQFSYQDME